MPHFCIQLCIFNCGFGLFPCTKVKESPSYFFHHTGTVTADGWRGSQPAGGLLGTCRACGVRRILSRRTFVFHKSPQVWFLPRFSQSSTITHTVILTVLDSTQHDCRWSLLFTLDCGMVFYVVFVFLPTGIALRAVSWIVLVFGELQNVPLLLTRQIIPDVLWFVWC